MIKYLVIAKPFITQFPKVKIKQVGKDLNSHADVLIGLVSIFEGKNGQTIVVDLISVPSYEVHHESVINNTKLGPRWMDLIADFLCHDKLLEDKKETPKL